MTTTKKNTKTTAVQDFSATDLVTVEVAEPHAVYWNGEQRTGTVPDVPFATAHKWMRNRWATYCWKQP
jgi:hypothetical protein